MEASTTERGDFIPYPINRVVGTVADGDHAHAAIDELLQAGFDRQEIDVLHGEADVGRLDPTGAEHGVLTQLQRTLIRSAAPNEEYKYLMRHVEDVRAGRFVIMVLARQREQRVVAADILNDHGAKFVGFYGRWAWEGLQSDVKASQPETDYGHQTIARRPEQLPSLFADAWNARNPDALAALFDEDAEFVNVTGLWWHDRESIRKAHAYGLERIFNESTLAVGETRVKPLRSDVAIVHARMMLSGHANIFSFVVHRTGNRWLCASAQNTDVVPNMETNIIDEDGIFRSASYRTGDVS